MAVYLPTGWDDARVKSARNAELASLGASDRNVIVAYRQYDEDKSMTSLKALIAAHNASKDEELTAAGLPTLAQADRNVAEAMGLENYDPTTQKELFDVASAMHKIENGPGEAWGFVVFKTWGYKKSEQARWDKFWKRWNELSDAKLRSMGAVGNLREGFNGKLQWWLVDHEDMDGKGIEEVRDCFAEQVEQAEETIPLGIDLDLALMIDKASIDSLLNEEKHPFVTGVDVNYDEEEAEDGYPGHFKIAIDILIPDLWQTLDAECAANLYPGPDRIYRGMMADIEDEMEEKTARAIAEEAD